MNKAFTFIWFYLKILLVSILFRAIILSRFDSLKEILMDIISTQLFFLMVSISGTD